MPTDRPFVAITRTIAEDIQIEGADVRVLGDGQPSRGQLLAFVAGATAIISMHSDRIDAELLDAAGSQLRGVCNHAVGFNNIDLGACRARNVAVTNTPDAVTEGTANLAMLLILAVARRLIWGDRFARSGDWERHGALGMAEELGLELCGRRLLIVGAGRIGYAAALRALAFGMRIEYVARSRHVEFESSPLAARRVDLEEGLRGADVVSLHVPLKDDTRHLINAERLAMMKEGAILVNTARGPVVDEEALVRTLESGRLWGAGLDVFEHEPRIHPGLTARSDVVLSPHVGSAEVRYRRMMAQMCAENVRAIIEGREPPNRVA